MKSVLSGVRVRAAFAPLLFMVIVVALLMKSATDARAQVATERRLAALPGRTIEILLNDRHVYIRPTKLDRNRVLGALRKGDAILIPARSLFAALGGQITVERDGRTVRATNAASTITLMVGLPKITVNGEVRPLDVAPQIAHGILYVPIRVLTEGLGAYVAWDSKRHVVAIRSSHSETSTSTAPPSLPTPLPPVATPNTSPAPTPTAGSRVSTPFTRYVAGDLNLAPKTFNEFNPGNIGKTTLTLRGAVEFELSLFGKRTRRFIEVDNQHWRYSHGADGAGVANGTPCSTPRTPGPHVGDPGCVSVIGGKGSAYVNPSEFTENDFALHSSIIEVGHTYVATSFLTHRNDYGYPTLKSSFGIGLERLPDFSRPLTLYANAYYYPEVHGTYSSAENADFELRYKVITYEAGLGLTIPRSPLFVQAGVVGNHYIAKQNAPSSKRYNALTIGVGIHL